MTSYVVFSIQSGISYEELKRPLQFNSDPLGLSNWILRFPLTIFSLDLKEKHVFNRDSVTISTNSNLPSQQKWKYFVVTRQDGSRLYCTAQVYYQRGLVNNCLRLMNACSSGERQNQSFYLPRCLVLMSSQPYFKIHVNLLKIHRQVRKINPNISHPINPKVIQSYMNVKALGKQREWSNMESADQKKQPSIEMIMKYYLGKCNQHKFGEVILLQKSSNWPILHLYKIRENSLFQFSHFFNLPLSTQTIKAALTCILLQKQLIITSKSQNLNVMIIQSLLQLLRPLKWQHMLVHNLPSHLIDAANQNFMPFIIGLHKKYLPLINSSDKYLLIIDEDKLMCPQSLPVLDFCLDRMSGVPTNPANSSHSNQKIFLEHAIEFVCRLMKPFFKKGQQNSTKYAQFYQQFFQTAIFMRFKQNLEKGELKDFERVALIHNPEERMQQIRRKLNQMLNLVQNPRILDNQVAWMEFYISQQQGISIEDGTQDQGKQCTLKQIKQNFPKQPLIDNHTRKTNEGIRQRSLSNAQMLARYNRSGQKLKISMVRPDRCHPLLAQLLEHKIGLSLPKNS